MVRYRSRSRARRGGRRIRLVLALSFVLLLLAEGRVSRLGADVQKSVLTAHAQECIADAAAEYIETAFVLTEGTLELPDTTVLVRQKAELTCELQKSLCSRIRYRVPWGSLTGCALLNGRGFKLPLVLAAEGSVSAEYKTELTAAGINRTRYAIILCVKSEIHSLSVKEPQSVTVESSFPVYESVLEGEIPQYLYDVR